MDKRIISLTKILKLDDKVAITLLNPMHVDNYLSDDPIFDCAFICAVDQLSVTSDISFYDSIACISVT